MASRRLLKKNINYVVGELLTECMISYYYIPGTDKEKTISLMNELSKMNADFVNRVSHTQPGNAAKYYNALVDEFNTRIDGIIDEMSKLKK